MSTIIKPLYCFRMYLPESLYDTIKERIVAEMQNIKLGTPLESDTFLSAVIDAKVSDWLVGWLVDILTG